MVTIARRCVHAALRRFGYDIVPSGAAALAPSPPVDYRYADMTDADDALFAAVEPFTMTTKERVVALSAAVRHVVRHRVPGDFVECGVWKGGSMMAVARTLLEIGDTTRRLYLFDTFEGMPPPADVDCDFRGESATDILAREERERSIYWAYAPIEEVRRNLAATGYPADKLVFVQGKVEDTIPVQAPDRIALLRLDTDWYESTRHELVHLYPRLSAGGVLLIDDYGHWSGARRAVDEYLADHDLRLLLHRVDYSARLCVKPGASLPSAE